MRQLGLGVRLRSASTLATFAPGENAAALDAIARRARGEGGSPLWLWGSPRSGRTHLLQAACAAADAAGRRAAYLPLGEAGYLPGHLAGLEALDLVALDDVGAVGAATDWQVPLFSLYQGLLERGGVLVAAADGPPASIDWPLADLGSRLRAAEVWQVRALAEEAQGGALVARAAALGLELPPETLGYLQRRLPRDFAALCDVLDRLDEAALAAQRALTVPFVRAVLDGVRGEGSGDTPEPPRGG